MLRAERDEKILKSRIVAAELRIKELKKNTHPTRENHYHFSFSIWKHNEAQVSYARTRILEERLKTDKAVLKESEGKAMELALYTALNGAQVTSKDPDERARLKDMIDVLEPEVAPALRLLAHGEKNIRKRAFGYQDWFKATGRMTYDPTMDLAMRSVARRYDLTIPSPLQMTPPPGVTINEGRIPTVACQNGQISL